MKLKAIALLTLTLLALGSCHKKSNPTKRKKKYFFTYQVRISGRITKPTIISGYYGKLMKYEGDFMPKTEGKGNEAAPQPVPVQNKILIYTAEHKGKIDSAAYREDGTTFYNLKQLARAKVKPKYVIKPNKSGFYQIDLGTGEYLALIKIKKNKAYFNGGVRSLSAKNDLLEELDLVIRDYARGIPLGGNQ